jgi:hypothetical protein
MRFMAARLVNPSSLGAACGALLCSWFVIVRILLEPQQLAAQNLFNHLKRFSHRQHYIDYITVAFEKIKFSGVRLTI